MEGGRKKKGEEGESAEMHFGGNLAASRTDSPRKRITDFQSQSAEKKRRTRAQKVPRERKGEGKRGGDWFRGGSRASSLKKKKGGGEKKEKKVRRRALAIRIGRRGGSAFFVCVDDDWEEKEGENSCKYHR